MRDASGNRAEEIEMDFMVLLYQDPATFNMTEAERKAEFAEYDTFTQEIKKNGHLLGGNPVQPDPAQARLVRVANGKADVMTGQLPTRKESLVGYYRLSCASADAAAALAAKIPAARKGFIEIVPEMAM